MEKRIKNFHLNTIIGAGLIVLGALFLLSEFINIHLQSYLWPFFIIVPGLAFFYFMLQGGKNAAALAIPGSIITATGLLLLYQSITHHWESWAYAWTLIVPTSLGVGFTIFGIWGENETMRKTGHAFVKVGLVLLIMFGLFFEMILQLSPHQPTRVLWPVLLVILGLYMVAEEIGIIPSLKSASSKETIEDKQGE